MRVSTMKSVAYFARLYRGPNLIKQKKRNYDKVVSLLFTHGNSPPFQIPSLELLDLRVSPTSLPVFMHACQEQVNRELFFFFHFLHCSRKLFKIASLYLYLISTFEFYVFGSYEES